MMPVSSACRRRDQHGHRLADRLLGGVAEQPLGAAVPAGDHAVEILLMMASSDDSTIAASRCRSCSARVRCTTSICALRSSRALSMAMAACAAMPSSDVLVPPA